MNYLLSIIIFIITVTIAVVFSMSSGSPRSGTRTFVGGAFVDIPSALSTKKKADGFTTHDRRVGFHDETSVMKYDTISGASLGVKRGALSGGPISRSGDSRGKEVIVGALEKEALKDVLRIAGAVREIGTEAEAEETMGAALLL